MSNKVKKREYFWKGAVVVLVAAVCLQSVITYRALKRQNGSKEQVEMIDSGNIQLAPRQITSYQYQPRQQMQPTQQSQSLAPPPIPKLNVNVNNMPGIKPSITPQPQQQYSQRQLSPSPGMKINISQSPFGMDIREEMAKMEEMMNAMMSRNGGGMGRMRMPSNRMSSGSRGSSPAISLDNDNNYVVQLNIPGLDKSEINAEINGNMLTISGIQREETDSSGQGGRSYVSSYSSFHNSFSLPGPAKAKGMKVDYKDNTLTVRVPKA